jgi:ATP-binding cassette subfamily B protein IrtB
MIAHRLKTVRNADQILVVDEGRIVQKGKHEELIGQERGYRLESAGTMIINEAVHSIS